MPPLFHGCLLSLLPSSVSSTWSSQDQGLALHPPEPQSKKLFFFINSREQTTDKHREARFGRNFRNVWFSNEPGAGEGSEFRLGKRRRKEVSKHSVCVGACFPASTPLPLGSCLDLWLAQPLLYVPMPRLMIASFPTVFMVSNNKEK